MDTTELILKFGWIGWTRDLTEIDALVDWLYKEYGIYFEEKSHRVFRLTFQGGVLCDYYGVTGDINIIETILPDILKLWKCENGRLEGPSLENYEEPNIDWT